MTVPKYENTGPIEVPSKFTPENLEGKSVIITGGAGGLGKAYAKAFLEAGAYVTIGDLSEEAGKKAVAELGKNVQFVKSDVRNWEEQVAVFEAALLNSPHKSIDIVVANAGLNGMGDSMVAPEDPNDPPTMPKLNILDVNLTGILYTTRLALHYFKRLQLKPDSQSDRCLILKSSLSAYVDWKMNIQYPVSKVAIRGLMKCLRRTTWQDGIRVNLVTPGYVDTGLIPPLIKTKLMAAGVEFGELDDAVKAVLRVATDKSVNGRSLGIVSRERASEGYMDLNSDDYKEDDVMYPMEQLALNINLG